jgi:hypothetical protein
MMDGTTVVLVLAAATRKTPKTPNHDVDGPLVAAQTPVCPDYEGWHFVFLAC